MLVQPHYEVLYRVAYRLTRSKHDAEDLAQEVCVRAYPRLAQLEQLEQPRGWLLRVMYRLFIDWSRRYERATGRCPLTSPSRLSTRVTSTAPGLG